MIELIENEKALALVNRYFTMLGNTGYVKQKTVSRYLLYLFLVDFVDTLYFFMTDEDYDKVSTLLTSLFSGAGCLLPYKLNCSQHAVVGLPTYMGYVTTRNTEDNETRITEDEYTRVL